MESLNDLESRFTPVKTGQSTDQLWERVLKINEHLHAREIASKNSIARLEYNAKKTVSALWSGYQPLYRTDTSTLILQQKELAQKLKTQFTDRQSNVENAYDTIEVDRKAARRSLEEAIKEYNTVRGKRADLAKQKKGNKTVLRSGASHNTYSTAVSTQGTILLAEKDLNYREAQSIISIYQLHLCLDQLVDRQSSVQDIGHAYGFAVNKLDLLARQLSAAYTQAKTLERENPDMATIASVISTVNGLIASTDSAIYEATAAMADSLRTVQSEPLENRSNEIASLSYSSVKDVQEHNLLSTARSFVEKLYPQDITPAEHVA